MGFAGMKRRCRILAFCAGLSSAVLCHAQGETPQLEPIPDPPPLPETLPLDEDLEAQVRIIREEDRVITQYLLNGIVHAVKIEHGGPFPPYYLVDTDGDGRLEPLALSDRNDRLLVAHWVLFRW